MIWCAPQAQPHPAHPVFRTTPAQPFPTPNSLTLQAQVTKLGKTEQELEAERKEKAAMAKELSAKTALVGACA